MFRLLYKMKNRTPEQAQKHREYMKEYYRKNEKQRLKNSQKSNKRGLEKIPCTTCGKNITRTNMKRHVMVKHKDTILAEVMVLKEE